MREITSLVTSGTSPISDQLKEILRKDLRALILFLLPHISTFKEDDDWLQSTSGLSANEIDALKRSFLREKIWIRDAEGRIVVATSTKGLGRSSDTTISLPELFTILPQILDCLTEDGPCWFEVRTVATTQAIKTQFLSEVGVALNKFIRASEESKAETVVSWVHVSLDSLKHLKGVNSNVQ